METETAPTDDPTEGPHDPEGPEGSEDPGSPDGPERADDPTAPPPTIRTAVRLMLVGAVISGIGILVTFMLRDDLREQLADADPSLTANELDTAVAAGLTLAGLVGVASVALWIWMATANGQGRVWARTVATVLGVLNVGFTLVGFIGGQLTPASVLIALANIALAVAILTLLYRPESNRFYDAVSRQQAAHH